MHSAMNLYSRDGMLMYDRRIYFLRSDEEGGADGGALYTIDLRCNNLDPVPGVRAYDFTGTGATLYYTQAGTWDLYRFDIPSASSTLLLRADGKAVTSLSLADGTLYFSLDGDIMKLDLETLEAAPVGAARGSSLNVVGNWVYYSNLDDREKLYPRHDGRRVQRAALRRGKHLLHQHRRRMDLLHPVRGRG